MNNISESYNIKIERSTLTGNFILIFNDIIFDSAVKRRDIHKVKDWLLKQLEINPPQEGQHFNEWSKTWTTQPPKTKAYMLVWKNGECKREVIYA
jgi:hypothetical protein